MNFSWVNLESVIVILIYLFLVIIVEISYAQNTWYSREIGVVHTCDCMGVPMHVTRVSWWK